MAFFADLPRELRQGILRYVFEDTAQKDADFNGHLKHEYLKCTTPSSLPTAMNMSIRSYIIASTQTHSDTPLKFIRGTWREMEKCRAFKESQEEYFAPHITEQATKLVAAFPDHKDDVLYVLDKMLDYLGEIVKEEDRAIALELKGLPTESAAAFARRGRFVGYSRLGAGYIGTQENWDITWSSPEDI
ncbi:hypothetical protein Vi05172_g3221 [Venturia inaequalis]|nr:hypothetical protein Vi05172_g3221 [Venturia inaequalis]